MSTVTPAPEEDTATSVEKSNAETTSPSAETPSNPTKYAIVKEQEDKTTPTEQPELESVGVEEGTPVPSSPSEEVGHTTEQSPQPNPSNQKRPKRVRSRRLSFADEMPSGKLCEVTYHTNLHYAQQDNGGSSNGDNSNNSNGGCCTIS
jgi:hypothetical protein